MYSTFCAAVDEVPPRATVTLFLSRRLNMYAKIVACIVRPGSQNYTVDSHYLEVEGTL